MSDIVVLIQASKCLKHPVIPAPSSTKVECDVDRQTSQRVPWTHVTNIDQLFNSLDSVMVTELVRL